LFAQKRPASIARAIVMPITPPMIAPSTRLGALSRSWNSIATTISTRAMPNDTFATSPKGSGRISAAA
jgi:hypothetical protein